MPSQAEAAKALVKPHAMSAEDVVGQLESDVQAGLSETVAQARQLSVGLNQIPEAKPPPAWRKLVAQFQDLVIGILFVAAIIAGAMGEWSDAVTILAIVLFNGILGYLQEARAERALSALRAMSSPTAKVLRGGSVLSVAAKELVPGDIIQLDAGDHVPADSRLVESYGLTVQEASMTGESSPVAKRASQVLDPQTVIADRVNMVFMGTVIGSGKATAIVTATAMQTELGQIAQVLSRTDSEPTPLQRRMAELGRVLVVMCLVLVGAVFTAQYLRGGELIETLLIATSLAVAAVPEGLPAVVTIALAIGLQRMVKRRALVRKLPSVETLGSVTVICSDKTGTLTRNEMTVREICVGTRCYRITGSGYSPQGAFEPMEYAASEEVASSSGDDPPVATSHDDTVSVADLDLEQALVIAARCNGASLQYDESVQNWTVIGDPTDGALLVMALKGHYKVDESDRTIVFEIPFDSERKTMSVIARSSDGRLILYHKGAPEVVLTSCTRELCNGQLQPLSNERRHEILARSSDMARRALRVLALAYRSELREIESDGAERDLIFVGIVGMMDPPRKEVISAVAECRQAGIRAVMITGDHPDTALAIGREIQIASDHSEVVTGLDLDSMSDAELERRVERIAVYARVSAVHKSRVVRAWKARGQFVAMTGDGVNDAPAVKAADIGIAMGLTGTDVTKEAADMVLTDDNFATIVSAVREARGIFDNIQKFVQYLLACNAGEVMLMFWAAILNLPLPLLALQILWINLVTDGFPALALAMEPPESDIMQQPPRPPRQPVITWRRGLSIVGQGVLIAMTALLGFYWVLKSDPNHLAAARSVAFCITAFSQLAFAMVCRSQRFTLPQLGLFSNVWLLIAIAASVMLQSSVFLIPAARSVFDVVPLTPLQWLLVIGCSLVPATVVEVRKLVVIGWKSSHQHPIN